MDDAIPVKVMSVTVEHLRKQHVCVNALDRVFFNEESKHNYIPIFMAVAHEILTR